MKGKTTPEDIERCLEIWEAAVRATHDFLEEGDIEFYKPFVRQECESCSLLFKREGGEVVAFLGMSMTSISMLFVDPNYRGIGLGRSLIEWAIHDYHVEKVEVNEQNEQAVGFYSRMGFEVERRTQEDGFGKPYPILWLRLKNPKQKMVKVPRDKKAYLSLLLLADPSEEMIDRYLNPSDMFVLEIEGKVIGEVVVDKKGEIKNLAVSLDYQGKYYGAYILYFLYMFYKDRFDYLWVGTSEYGIGFYEYCGFGQDHTIKNFFMDNYPEPIMENGVQCVDMIYLKIKLKA